MTAVNEACEFHSHKFVKPGLANSVALVVYLPDTSALPAGTRQYSQSPQQTAAREQAMKQAWSKPQVEEQQVGMEVSSYLPAELDGR